MFAKPVLFSSFLAIFNSFASSNGFAVKFAPKGSPSLKPIGKVTLGKPAKFAIPKWLSIARKSPLVLSPTFSLNLGATVGEAGT